MSVITLAELRYGAASSSRSETNQQAIDRFTLGVSVIAVDSTVAATFGSIKAELRKQGALLEDFDVLICGLRGGANWPDVRFRRSRSGGGSRCRRASERGSATPSLI